MSGLRRDKPAKPVKAPKAARTPRAKRGTELEAAQPTEAGEPTEPELTPQDPQLPETVETSAPVVPGETTDTTGSTGSTGSTGAGAGATGRAATEAATAPRSPSSRKLRRATSRRTSPAADAALPGDATHATHAAHTDAASSPVAVAPSSRASRRARGARGRSSKPGPEAVPAVNLLSPWVLEEIHVRVLRRRFGYAAVALVLVLGLAWGGLTLRGNQARTDAAYEESFGTNLASQIQEMAPVRAYVGGVDVRAQSVTDVMEGQVAFSAVLRGLEAALPPNASLDTMTVTLPTPAALGTAATDASGTTGTVPTDPAAGTCPGPDPFAANDVLACIDITGTASSRDVVSTLVLRLSRNPSFAEPFVSATTASEDEEGTSVTFTGSVALTDEVANTRFADLVERLGSTKVAAAAQAAREARESEEAQKSQSPGSGSGDEDDTVTAGSTTPATTEEPS